MVVACCVEVGSSALGDVVGVGEHQRSAQSAQQRRCAERVERHPRTGHADRVVGDAAPAGCGAVAVGGQLGGLGRGLVASAARHTRHLDAEILDGLLDGFAERCGAAHQHHMADGGLPQVAGHVGVQFVRRAQQHRMDSPSSERACHQSVREHLPAGDHRSAAQTAHRARHDPSRSRHTRAVQVIARDTFRGDAGLAERSQHTRFHAASGAVHAAARVRPHHQRLRDARPPQELQRVSPQPIRRRHQHRRTQRTRHWCCDDRIRPPPARHQHHPLQRTARIGSHRLGHLQRRLITVRAAITNH